jgi:hypothetical protein
MLADHGYGCTLGFFRHSPPFPVIVHRSG